MIPLIFPNGPQMVDSYRNPLDVLFLNLGGEFLVMNAKKNALDVF